MILNDGSNVLVDDEVYADEDISHNCTRTPIKSHWILPFLNDELEKMPNMSNREMKNLIAPYVKNKFMTPSLLQKYQDYC